MQTMTKNPSSNTEGFKVALVNKKGLCSNKYFSIVLLYHKEFLYFQNVPISNS